MRNAFLELNMLKSSTPLEVSPTMSRKSAASILRFVRLFTLCRAVRICFVTGYTTNAIDDDVSEESRHLRCAVWFTSSHVLLCLPLPFDVKICPVSNSFDGFGATGARSKVDMGERHVQRRLCFVIVRG